MSDKNNRETSPQEDTQFQDFLKRLENQGKEPALSEEAEAEKQKSGDEEVKEEGDAVAEKKISDEEKDSISKQREDLKEDSLEDDKESSVVSSEEEVELNRTKDTTHMKKSATEIQNSLMDEIELERSRRMRFVTPSDDKETEDNVEELSEEDEEAARIAEMQEKKERERLEKEFRQQQFKDAHERSLRYQEHSRIINESNRRNALQQEMLRSQQEQEFGLNESLAGVSELDSAEQTKDEFLEDYLKKISESSKNTQLSEAQSGKGLKVKNDDASIEDEKDFAQSKLIKQGEKVSDYFNEEAVKHQEIESQTSIKSNDAEGAKSPAQDLESKFGVPIFPSGLDVTAQAEEQGQAVLTRAEREKFAAELHRANSNSQTLSPVQSGDELDSVSGISQTTESPLAKDTFADKYIESLSVKGGKLSSNSSAPKEELKRDKLLDDPLLSNNSASLKTKDAPQIDAEAAVDEIAGQAQSIVQSAGPTMGQDSSQTDESRKKSNAKKVVKSVSKVMQESMAGEEVTVDGVAIQLTKGTNAEHLASPLKDTSLNTVVGYAMSIDNKKKTEDQARSGIQGGITVAGKKAEEGTLGTSAEKLLDKMDSGQISSDDSASGQANSKSGSVDKSRKPIESNKDSLSHHKGGVRGQAKAPVHQPYVQHSKTVSADTEVAGSSGTVGIKYTGESSLQGQSVASSIPSDQLAVSNNISKGRLHLSRHSKTLGQPADASNPSVNKIKLHQGGGELPNSSQVGIQGDSASLAGRSVKLGRVDLAQDSDAAGVSAKSLLSEHAGAIASVAGQLLKPNDSDNNKEMNPTSIAKSIKSALPKASSHKTSSVTAKGIISEGDATSTSKVLGKNKPIESKPVGVKQSAADAIGKKPTERQLVNKTDGSLRIVREGHDAGIKEIKPDSLGLAKQEANKKALEGRNVETKAKFKDVKKDASQEYHDALKKRDGNIRLGRDGKFETTTKEGRIPRNSVSKINSRPDFTGDKIVGKTGGKMANVNVGRSAKISTKGGALTEQAESMRKGGAFIRNFMQKNGLNTAVQTAQTGAQTNMIAQVVAKKAVATAAMTGISAGGIAGGTAAIQNMAPKGDFSVIAASVYDSETDETPLTQDAVDMLQARFKAYSKLASGKTLSASELEEAGGNYTPLVEVPVATSINGKPVTSSTSKFKFVDRDGKNIDKDKFLLDDYSDLVFPSEGIASSGGNYGSSNVDGGYTGVGTTSNETTPGNTYPWGQCTWGCKQMAPWIPNYMGNANMWLDSTRSNGLETGTTPEVGSIAVFTGGGGGYGHVAYVSEINGSQIKILEANYGGSAYGADPRGIGEYRGWIDPVASGITGYIYPPSDIRNQNNLNGSSNSSSNGNSSNSNNSSSSNSSNSSGSAKKDENGQTQMDIMFNIVGALETGGQVYGQRDYANFINVETGAEVTATLGWSSFYGVHGKQYLQRFKQENPDLFSQLDQGGQVAPVLNIEWEATGWQANPTQKASIVDMLTTDQGKKLQDTMTAERLVAHWKKAASLYTDNMRAIAWYTNIAELAGEGVADPFFESLGGNYDSNHIYNTLITTWNRGGATIGASMYHRRHQLYKQWIEENYAADEKVDLDNIEVTGAGRIDAGGSNPNSSSENRAGQILLIKEILAMAAIGSHYGQPNQEEDFFKYCIEVMDNAIKGKDGNGISITYSEGEKSATAKVEFKVLSDLYELEKLDTKFNKWDLTDETYGDLNPQAYMALPNADFEEIFNIKIKPTATGSSSGGSGLPYVKWALSVAENPDHGYSQINRNGNPDYDCSSFVWYALNQAGFDVGSYAFATPTMPSTLQAAGFTMYTINSLSDMQAGDILLRDGHTEIYLGDGKMVGAHADESGGIAGTLGGDQGIGPMGGIGEISIVPTDAASWTWGFRPPADYVAENSDSSSGSKGDVQFDSNGLLKEQSSDKGQEVINLLLSIPGHSNGAHLHKEWGIDDKIDQLSTEEAIWVN